MAINSLCLRTSIALVALVCPFTAQQPISPQHAPSEDGIVTIRTSAHLVILDVSLWDWKGAPVTGLNKDAFHLLEDGQEQAIRTVEEHSPMDPAVARQNLAAVAAKLPPNTFTNFKPFTDPPANVIVLDALTSPAMMQPDHFDQVKNLLKRAAPGTPFIIFRLDKQLHLVQGLTMDTALLRAAVEELKPTQVFPDNPGYFMQRRQLMNTAVGELTRYLAATPGRKTVYWYTYLLGHDLASSGDPASDSALHDQLCSWTDSLEQNRIDVYRLGSDPGNLSSGLGCRPGRSFPTIEKAIDAEAHFYTLSYTPTNGNWDGRYRKLSVDLNTKGTPWKGVKLDYRDGYFGRADDGSVRPGVISNPPVGSNADSLALRQAMTIGAPEPDDVVFEVAVNSDAAIAKDTAATPAPAGNFLSATLRAQGYRRFNLHYVVRADQLHLIASPNQAAYAEKLEVVTVVYDSLGTPVNSRRSIVSVSFSGPDDPRLKTASISADLTTQVPVSGTNFLRVGVRDVATDKVGSLEIAASAIKPVPEAAQ